MAVDLHSRQARKGSGVPYLGHLLGVCGLVIDAGGSEDEAIARRSSMTRSRTRAVLQPWSASVPDSEATWPPSSRPAQTPT